MTERYIGLCMAAGGVKTGFDTVIGEVRAKRARLVLVASDVSERTRKQLTDKCTYYGVKCIAADYSSDELAHMTGKKYSCAAIAFTGKGPYKNVEAALTKNNDQEISDHTEKTETTERMIVDGDEI